MENGWIKLHRKMSDHQIYSDPYLLKLWLHCLMKASHTEREQLVGRQIITIFPGQFVTGRDALATEFNKNAKKDLVVSSRTLWRWMKTLEQLQMLSIKSETKFSVVTVLNWSNYQNNDQQVSSKCPTNDQQVSTNKNVKKEKNVKNNNTMSSKHDRAYPFDEIISYLNQKCRKNFRANTKATQSLIKARMNEGFTLDDFKQVIDTMATEWSGKTFSNGSLGDNYLQPSTLFGTKFESYLNQQVTATASGVSTAPTERRNTTVDKTMDEED